MYLRSRAFNSKYQKYLLKFNGGMHNIKKRRKFLLAGCFGNGMQNILLICSRQVQHYPACTAKSTKLITHLSYGSRLSTRSIL